MRKYKLFGKIPIFDLLVILVLAVVAIVGVKVISSSKSGVAYTTTETKELILTVKFSNLSKQIVSDPKPGEKVIENTTNNTLGTVVSYEKTDYVIHDFSDLTGDNVSTVIEDRYNMIVKIKATATVSDILTEINGTKVGIGRNVECSMPSLSSNGVIINIEEVNAK